MYNLYIFQTSNYTAHTKYTISKGDRKTSKLNKKIFRTK